MCIYICIYQYQIWLRLFWLKDHVLIQSSWPGCWLLGPGVLALGAWLLGLGCWLLGLGPWALALGSWVLAIGSWSLALGTWILALGPWILALGYWILGPRPSLLGLGSWPPDFNICPWLSSPFPSPQFIAIQFQFNSIHVNLILIFQFNSNSIQFQLNTIQQLIHIYNIVSRTKAKQRQSRAEQSKAEK